MESDRLAELVPQVLSGLKGCGGAGFPTAFKWKAVRTEVADPADKFIVCNADEAEPGTFKDAWLLRGDQAVRVLRGMVLAGQYCGASRGFVYLRAEYSEQRESLQKVIAAMVQRGELAAGSGQVRYGAGFPGRPIDPHNHGCEDVELSALDWHIEHGGHDLSGDPLETGGMAFVGGGEGGFRSHRSADRPLPERKIGAIEAPGQNSWPFRLEICVSGGAYICGEETALLESMEGRRPQPRHKPPFPTQSGLWGQPTLINNVETFWWAERGLEHQVEVGGRRLYSVSGAVQKPGVFEAPVGISARELIENHAGGLCAGAEISCFIPGGAATGILPPAALDAALSPEGLAEWNTAMGTGGLVVFAQPTSPRQVASQIMRFFAQESCSQCTPCRQGCHALAEWLEGTRQWTDAQSRADWLEAMEQGSICGLGFTAPATVRLLDAFGQS
jgi:NADH:ubiquinone oxidoreductase subunit F (NADH-binding)